MDQLDSEVTVNLLGTQHRIACRVGEEELLEKSSRYLNEQVEKLQSKNNVIGLERISLMAAMNISYELHTLLAERGQVETSLAELEIKLTKALDEPD